MSEKVMKEKKSLDIKKIFTSIKENRIVNMVAPIALLVIMCLFFDIINPRFLGASNVKSIIKQALTVAIVATGASFIFATGNVNIAMGSATALTATLAAMLYSATGSFGLAIVAAVILGVAIMFICSIISAKFHVAVVFVTIVMMVLLSAIQQELVSGGDIKIDATLTKTLENYWVPEIIFFAFVIVCIVIFHFTKIGRSLKLIGENEVSSEFTGISRNKYLIIAFIIAGIGVGLGAITTLIRNGVVDTNTCSSMNNDVMLAIVLGGMPIYGGSKSKGYSATIGAITVIALNKGLIVLGVDSTVMQGVRGIIFLILVYMGSKRTLLLPARED